MPPIKNLDLAPFPVDGLNQFNCPRNLDLAPFPEIPLFNCHFSWQCMEKVMCWLQIQWRGRGLNQICKWIRSRYKGNKLQRKVALAAIATTVYAIWRNRNKAYWEQTVNTVDSTVQEIKFNVKNRCLQILSTKVLERDRSWLESL